MRAVAGAEPAAVFATHSPAAEPPGMQPRCVQAPNRTSHFSLPGLTRAASACGSGRDATLTARASSISWRCGCART